MFRILDFQTKVINRLDSYLEQLKINKNNANQVQELISQNPDLNIPLPNFVQSTIRHLRTNGELPEGHDQIPYHYLHREDGCSRPVPNVLLKVPTAGGKTYLAVRSIERILSNYLEKNTGFILWIVSNEAIYTQTLKNLNDRNHVYRQTLDNAAAGNVKILEKNSSFNAMDVESNLCVMIIMLQSINREQAVQLTAFRDRGDVQGFFPGEGEMEAHEFLQQEIPNLDVYEHHFTLIKESLGNALRVIRPIIVVDEGHKVTSDLATSTIYGFNPCFVLELTATPKNIDPKGGEKPRVGRYANTLVEITGREVDNEGMIKMPINLNPMQGEDWINTLSTSLTQLNDLHERARQYEAESGRYIRPIMLVQVERTGADQLETGLIHSEDVRAQLLNLGLAEEEIAVKTAEINDLSNPENLNLLSPENRIRVIITKHALQEGWNCPFAYVICALAATSNMSGMTQLIGRILRQPGAIKTEVPELDQCYIITHRAETEDVIRRVRESLESEGLGDVVIQITGGVTQAGNGHPRRELNRRGRFTGTEIYLPQVLFIEDDEARVLDYGTDILSQIDWRSFDVSNLVADFPNNSQAPQNQLQRIGLDEDGNICQNVVSANTEVLRFDSVYVSRAINNLVPNTFVAYQIVQDLLEGLLNRGDINEIYVGQQMNLVIERLRVNLDAERDRLAEQIFREGLDNGTIQFILRADGNNWQMPHTELTNQPAAAFPLLNTMQPLSSSLFESVYQADLNPDEQSVALFLEREETIKWWHRNVARRQYGIQGWRRNKMYPDFLFTIQRQDGTIKSIRILETKGNQLDNLDTAYKRSVMETLTEHFSYEEATDVGDCIIRDEGISVGAKLIMFGDITADLPNWISEEE